MFGVGYLSRFFNRPSHGHLAALERMLNYLSGTIGIGITISSGLKSTYLVGYSDNDRATDQIDRTSLSRYLFFLWGHYISWGSKKKSCVVISTMGSEFVPLGRVAQEMLWLSKLEVPSVRSGGRP